MRRILSSLLCGSLLLAAPLARATDSDGDGVADESDALPCEPSGSAIVYVPAKAEHSMLVFEDLWPKNGDLDFNDQVFGYNYVFVEDYAGNVSALQLTINVLAVGAGVNSGLWLHLPVPADAARSITLNFDDGATQTLTPASGETDLVIKVLGNTRSVFTGGASMINTESTTPSLTGHPINVLIRFATPVALDVAQAPFDLFIERTDTPGHQIHMPQYGGTDKMDKTLFGTGDDGSTADRHFVNKNGLPFALNVPLLVAWPRERVAVETVYPDIVGFANSGGMSNLDWYDTNVNLSAAWTGGSNNTDPPVPTMAGPVFPYIDDSCVGWRGTVQFGGASQLWVRGSTAHPSGDIFVTGEIYVEKGKHWDGFLARFDKTGMQLWLKTFGDSKKSDYARAVATDATGNAYVVGVTGGAFGGASNLGGDGDAFLAKFDPDGKLLWNKQFGGNQYEEAFGVAVDGLGFAAVSGYTNGEQWGKVGSNRKKSAQAFVVTFDNFGRPLWSQQYDFGSEHSIGAGISYSLQGKLLLSLLEHDGDLYQGSGAKVGAQGAVEWNTKCGKGQGDTMKWAQGVASDGNGGAYITGYVQRAPACHPVKQTVCYSKNRCYTVTSIRCDNIFDAYVEKMGGNGAISWERRLTPTPAPGLPYAYAIGQAVIADGNGGVYMGGGVWGALPNQNLKGDYDYFLSRYDGNGNRIFVTQDGGSDYDYGTSVCIDGDGSPFLSGYTLSNLGGQGTGKGFVVKFTPQGQRL